MNLSNSVQNFGKHSNYAYFITKYPNLEQTLK